ncbi:hypothetical protein CR513_52883, partial [Mucuna pruriens]
MGQMKEQINKMLDLLTQGTGPTPGTQGIIPLGEEKLNSLEECVRIIEGIDSHGLDVVDLYLVPDIVLPVDFKTPKFEKYKGSSCPHMHLAMYWAALSMYVNLEKGRVKTWRDLAKAFIRQYKYNEDMTPDRSWL